MGGEIELEESSPKQAFKVMKSGLVDNTPQPLNGQKPRHNGAENGGFDDNTNGGSSSNGCSSSSSRVAIAAAANGGGKDDDRPSAYVANNRDAVCRRWQSCD